MHNMARYRYHDTFFACFVPRRLTKGGKRHEKVKCLGLVCVLLSLLACAGMAEAPTEVEDAEMASFRALAETYVPMAVEDYPDHTVFQVIGSMKAQQLKNAYCLRCNNAIRTIWGGASYKLSDSACPHTLYMIQDPYEDQLVPANDYTHLQGQAHTSLCADATEARRIKGWC